MRHERRLLYEKALSRLNYMKEKGLLDQDLWSQIVAEAPHEEEYPEDLLIKAGVRKADLLVFLSSYHEVPFVEFREDLKAPQGLIDGLDLQALRESLWFPISQYGREIGVIAYWPRDPFIQEQIRSALGGRPIRWFVALPSDIVRIIEEHQDVLPHFPHSSGRTPLARVRTFLASKRTQFAWYRTLLSESRTGLALIRTGVSFVTISLLMLRIVGGGYLWVLEGLLMGAGAYMTVEGLSWYLKTRGVGRLDPSYSITQSTHCTSVLEMDEGGKGVALRRSRVIEGADKLRSRWECLTPLMRRRFLAVERTDLAEERTFLASCRTHMARARTGLAFTRTGIAFVGLGILTLKQFSLGPWTILDAGLIATGIAMTMEGLHWYFPGRRAGRDSLREIRQKASMRSIWDFAFHRGKDGREGGEEPRRLDIPALHGPGIWGTTGLALERTLLAERRNVKARLRTVMARSRTGLAFIRTGVRLFSVGLGLMIYFGLDWGLLNALEIGLMMAGVLFTLDGLRWHLPAEREKRQYPYCFWDTEIVLADYGKPPSQWRKVVYSHDGI